MRHLVLSMLLVCVTAAAALGGDQKRNGFYCDQSDPDWSGHFIDGEQVGALYHPTGDYYAYDRYADRWTRSGVSPRLLRSPGVIGNRTELGKGWFLDDQPIGDDEAAAWLEGNPAIPDDVRKLSLTVIGPPAARQLVARDLTKVPELRQLLPEYVTQFYDPSDPMIVSSGHMRGGNPTVYVQKKNGEVIFRNDSYPGPNVMNAAMRTALQIGDELRRPDPDYRPVLDPTAERLIGGGGWFSSLWKWFFFPLLFVVGLWFASLGLFLAAVAGVLGWALLKRIYAAVVPSSTATRRKK